VGGKGDLFSERSTPLVQGLCYLGEKEDEKKDLSFVNEQSKAEEGRRREDIYGHL
jgi:hypothetical protein